MAARTRLSRSRIQNKLNYTHSSDSSSEDNDSSSSVDYDIVPPPRKSSKSHLPTSCTPKVKNTNLRSPMMEKKKKVIKKKKLKDSETESSSEESEMEHQDQDDAKENLRKSSRKIVPKVNQSLHLNNSLRKSSRTPKAKFETLDEGMMDLDFKFQIDKSPSKSPKTPILKIKRKNNTVCQDEDDESDNINSSRGTSPGNLNQHVHVHDDSINKDKDGVANSRQIRIRPTPKKQVEEDSEESLELNRSVRRSSRVVKQQEAIEDSNSKESIDPGRRKSLRVNPPRKSVKDLQNKSMNVDMDSPESSKTVKTDALSFTPRKSSRTPKKAITNTPLKSPMKSPCKQPGTLWRFNSLGVPMCPLPCRESQFEEIWGFLNENIAAKSSRCMYVSGVPGTGKTVIVQSVVDTLMRYATERKKHLEFQYVYINGLSLGSPDKLWKRFYQGLEGKKINKSKKLKITSSAALKKLNSHFETKGRLPAVLVIDELDQILDKKQSILYQLLEWASQPSTMFSLIAIFNTMSLPENGLVMRNVSRMGLVRCIFPPYTHEQLQTIITSSIAACKSEKIKDEAITLLSRKVAAVSGDARRALEIAKRSIEIIETDEGKKGISAVVEAFKEIFSSVKVDTMKNCSELEKLFLRSLSAELHSTGNEETTLMNVFGNLCNAAVYDGYNWTKSQFIDAALRLSMLKLIIMENDCQSIHKRISLNVPVEDVNFALKADI